MLNITVIRGNRTHFISVRNDVITWAHFVSVGAACTSFSLLFSNHSTVNIEHGILRTVTTLPEYTPL